MYVHISLLGDIPPIHAVEGFRPRNKTAGKNSRTSVQI